jgi:hypothetical protein
MCWQQELCASLPRLSTTQCCRRGRHQSTTKSWHPSLLDSLAVKLNAVRYRVLPDTPDTNAPANSKQLNEASLWNVSYRYVLNSAVYEYELRCGGWWWCGFVVVVAMRMVGGWLMRDNTLHPAAGGCSG